MMDRGHLAIVMDLYHVLGCELTLAMAKGDLVDGTRANLRALEEDLVLLGVLLHLPRVHRVGHVCRCSIEPHLFELAVVRQSKAAPLPPVLQVRAAFLMLWILQSIVAGMVLVAAAIVEDSVRASCRHIGRLIETNIERVDFILLWVSALLSRVLHELLQGLVRVYFLLLQVVQGRVLQYRCIVSCIVSRRLLSFQMVEESPCRYLHAFPSHVDSVRALRRVLRLSIVLPLLCAFFV